MSVIEVNKYPETGGVPSNTDATKIANGTVNNTEFQYLNGVTSAIQTQLNSKASTSHNHNLNDLTEKSYNSLTNKPTIPSLLSQLAEDATHRTVTDAEKSTWNSKQDQLVSGTNIKTVGGVSILGSGDLEVGGGAWDGMETVDADISVSNNQSNLNIVWSSGLFTAGTYILFANVLYDSDNDSDGVKFEILFYDSTDAPLSLVQLGNHNVSSSINYGYHATENNQPSGRDTWASFYSGTRRAGAGSTAYVTVTAAEAFKIKFDMAQQTANAATAGYIRKGSYILYKKIA